MSIKSEIDKTASYLRNIRSAIKNRGGQISETAGLKDLPAAVNSIPSGSFDNSLLLKIVDGSVTELTEYDLKGLTSISSNAFTSKRNLTQIVIPDSVKDINRQAFGWCVNLKNVVIGDGVTIIYDEAFFYCLKLESLRWGKSISRLRTQVFRECYLLKKVYITDLESWCAITYDDNMSSPLFYGANLYLNDMLLNELVIPDGVSEIGKFAFYKQSQIESVNMPNSVTSIGSYAFFACGSLTSVTIPDSVTSIGSAAFLSCTGIKKIIMPSAITEIGSSAFDGVSNCLEYDFSKSTIVPTLSGADVFSNINESCKIKVPSSLYDEWIVATNWVSLRKYIVAV